MIYGDIKKHKINKTIADNYYDLLSEEELDNNLIELLNNIDMKREEIIVIKNKYKKSKREK